MDPQPPVLKCLDVRSWRPSTREELRANLESVQTRSIQRKQTRSRPKSILAVRQHLSPVDMYCYLKGRFGEPNGFQNFLRNDHSDNYIHWDFNLKAGDEDVYICSTNREIHFILSETLTDENWRDLILNIKRDYVRVAGEKAAILRVNRRQFEAFLRSHIDAKIFDLPYKCEGFATSIEPSAETYKKFKRVMDKRNNAIHGNVDPAREQIETVYFEGTRPLFKEPGDHIGKRLDVLEHEYEPEQVITDYEDTYSFLCSIVRCLEPSLQTGIWRILEDHHPGYDVNRGVAGALFPDHVATGHPGGIRCDDELTVVWPA